MPNNHIENLEKELQLINKLKETFPDLVVKQNRWKRKYHCSKTANALVDKVHFGATCGCCSDAGILAYFYLKLDGVNVYADPYSIEVGEKGWEYDRENLCWKEELEKAGINNPEIKKSISNYFYEEKEEYKKELKESLEELS